MGIQPAVSSRKSGSLRRALYRAREWLFPLTRCVACHRAAYDGLCEGCAAQVRFFGGLHCVRCGVPLGEPGLCGECYTEAPPFDRAEYVALHRAPWSGAITSFKYGGVKTRSRGLARVAAGHCERTGLLQDVDCLVPVPLHPKARVKRGFNQCELVCRELWFLTGMPWERGLIRVKAGEPQVTLTGAQRREKIRGAFKPRSRRAIHGKRVLLVDDVYTTGATIREAAKALKKGGASEIRVLTLARALTGTMPDQTAVAAGTDEFTEDLVSPWPV
ncbi:MAG: phosphoribosyltransferase family protein [bacterium]